MRLSLEASKLPHEEYEIIVVNNASTDNTKQVAEAHGARVIDEPRKGITRAKEAGFRAARGELVAHPDADTKMPREWVSKALAAFERHPNMVAMSGPYVYYDLSRAQRALVFVFYVLGFISHVIIQDVLRKGAMIQGGNYVVRRAALERAGGYDTSIEFYGEDFDLARRIAAQGRVKWFWSFYTYSSGRRLLNEGLLMTGIRYGANNMASIFLKRPLTRVYKDIRPGTKIRE